MKTTYLSIEGGDGSGKTTLVKNLMNEFQKLNKKVLLTKEFGSEHDKFCKDLRSIALSSEYQADEIAGQILFGAIIKQHQEKVIKPTIKNKTHDIILSDRGIHSNFAYGPSHGISSKTIKDIFKIPYQGAVLPHLTIYLDIDPLLALERRSQREPEKFQSGGVDRVELKGVELQKKVRKNFLNLAKKDKRIKVVKITKEKTAELVLLEVLTILKKFKVI